MATDLYEISGLCVDVEYMIMGVLANNVYIVSDGEGTMVVDPSCSADKILAALGERKLDAIVLTHSHFDHTGAAAELREATGAPVIASAIDAPLIEEPCDEDLSTRGVPCPVDRTVAHGDVVEVGNMKWKVIATPGHTPGSIALLDRQTGFLFSGDAINGQTWLQLDHSLKLQQYLDSLNALDPLRPYIKELHNGHNVEGVPAAYIDEMKDAIRTIIETHGAGDEDYTWFGGTCKRHWMRENTWVLYTPDKL